MEKLTEQQIKTLKLFSYYCQANAADEVDKSVYINNCEVNWSDDYFRPPLSSRTVEGYETINNLLDEITDKLIDEFDDCELGGEIRYNIDCIERKINAEILQLVYNEETTVTEYELEVIDDESINDFFETVVKNNNDIGVVNFDGAGDSGYIDKSIVFGGSSRYKLPEKVLGYLYEILGSNHGGWEINEGSFGNFEFDYVNKRIVLNFNYRMEDYFNLGSKFYAEF